MKAPLLLTLASLAAAFPLAAQSASAALSGESDGDFRDPGICQLVDAAEALRAPSRPAAPDASRCTADSLLFGEIHSLSTGESEPFPISTPEEDPSTAEVPAPAPEIEPVSSAAAPDPPATQADPATAGLLPAVQAAVTDVPPAGPVPEPSGILLVLGAAAWILLRRNH